MNIFKRIGSRIEKSPFKVLLLTVVIFALLIAGAVKVNMATGNETLVDVKGDAYMSNNIMEKNFGGDSILILFEGEREDLLSIGNIEKMWNVENQFKYEENIFSFMSPASIVHQMTDKQGEQIKEKIPDISDGLGEMSGKLIEIGTELGKKDVPNPNEIEKKLDNLMASMDPDSIMEDMLKQQETEMSKMNDQVSTMSGGLDEMGDRLIGIGTELASKDVPNPKEIEGKLNNLMNTMDLDKFMREMPEKQKAEITNMMAKMEKEIGGMKSNLSGGISPDELKSMSSGLITMGENLKEMSGGLSNLPDKMGEALTGAQDPSSIFADMTSQIETEVQEMKSNLSGGIDPDELKTMADGFVTMGENLEDLSEGLATFHTKSGMMVADIPSTQDELDNILYDEDKNLRTIFDDVIVDDTHNMMVIKLQGNLEDSYKDAIYADVSKALENESFEDISFTVSGKPVLDSSLRTEMKSNMKVMIALAVVIMFIILLLVFHIRWRVLSLGIIFISVIATLGFMGTMSVPMTMVSMAVFPILIGLGIDYSIQLQNRYEEEKSVKITLTQIGKSVFIAVLATVLGFISLYASPVPMIKDFGKMLTIGVIISFIGSVFLLMPILHIRDTSEEKIKKTGKNKDNDGKETRPVKMLKASTRFVVKHSIVIIIIVVALAGFGFSVDNDIGVETDIETFMPQDMDALKDIHEIRDIVGSTNQMVIYMEGEKILTETNIDWIDNLTEDITNKFEDKVVDIKSISTLASNMADEDMDFEEYLSTIEDIPEEQKKMFLNEDGNKSVILLNVSHMSTQTLQEFVNDLKDTVKDAPMNVEVTGKSVLDVEMVKGLTEGRVKMTIIGLALVFMALLLMYKNLVKAFIPIFPIILIIGMSAGIMYLLGIKYTPITATLGALVLGMGTEMTIMLLERYIEERSLGKEKTESMLITVTKIGKATIASGLTTIGGFSVLMVSKFVILKDFGLMTVINISLALISTFIVLPIIILLLDRFIVDDEKIKQIRKEKAIYDPYWDHKS